MGTTQDLRGNTNMEIIKNKEEIIEKTLEKFYPMNEEEQKTLLFVLITSYLECLEGMKNNKTGTQIYEKWLNQKETYDFIMRLFVKPPKELTANGVQTPRDYTFAYAKKQYESLYGKREEA